MKISLNWLQNFVELTETDHETIKEVITARTAEVETMENTGAHLDGVVLGKVEKLMNHPNADKLQIARVNDGQNVLQVVCGGSNLKEGMKVAYAKIGAVVKWHGDQVVKMEKAKIRGEESSGMICASEEIELSEMFPKQQEKEIVNLSHLDAPIGTPLAKVLGLDDVVIDIDNHAITNRPDLFSHRGFAREFVANGLAKWKKGAMILPEIEAPHAPCPVEFKLTDPNLCSHYLAVYLTGIEVKESPDWMRHHLTACGVRPISNIVDITNYVMLELGMPSHAFDLDQIKGKTWTMRPSKKGEKVITLDEKEFELFEGITVFDDGNELFDLCGVMGGLHSGINQHTHRVLLHVPVYNPIVTRRAMRGLGQISDAAIIYEKGVDNELAIDALKRLIQLILEICPNARVASEVVQIKNYSSENRVIHLENERLTKMIGQEIPAKEVERILDHLGYELEKNSKGYAVTVPTWRYKDTAIQADIIEDVARIYGYDKIQPVLPEGSIRPAPVNARREYEKSVRQQLTAYHFNEIYTFAFTGPELIEKAGLKVDESSIEIENPISSDMSVMRQSLLPRTLETIADNLRYQKQFRLFELSRTYHKKGDGAEEKSALILASVGEDFRSLQGIAEDLGAELKPTNGTPPDYQHPGRTAQLTKRGQNIGFIYELHPLIAKNFDIKTRVMIAEIEMETIHGMNINHRKQYTEIPKYPAIQRDISLLIPKHNLAQHYFKAIEKTDKKLIQKVELIDEYTGNKIEADKRSLTYSITYQADDRTLTEEEVNEIHASVLENLKQQKAIIRD